ncbi:MAG: hypothetical protein L6R39_001650, partial [Caloplaca ligustica]
MELPPFAPFPPAGLRKDIVPEEWELCLDAWLLLAEGQLLLPLDLFVKRLAKDPSVPKFLCSYVMSNAQYVSSDKIEPKSKQLRRRCYLLAHRCLSEPKQKSPLLMEWEFLSDFSIVYARSPSLSPLLQSLWQAEKLDSSFKKHKAWLIKTLEDGANKENHSDLETTLTRTAALLRACPAYGHFLMLGSDFVDTLLRERIAGPEAIRAEKLINQLSAYAEAGTSASKRKKLTERRADKGKGKQKDEYGHGAFDGRLHVHKMSLVTQIQDLFPDLGSGFIVKLLDEYGDDSEQVTAHLLDDSLPPHLQCLDRSESLPQPPSRTSPDLAPNLAPRPTPPLLPTRHNIHDNDAFDRLAISPTQLHRGLKSSSHTADTMLEDRSSAPNKAAILSALAAFDSDDDERDDTYDVDDVGGTVDTAIPGSDEVDTDLRDQNEEALFRAWGMTPEVFERDAVTRRGKAR